MPTEGKADYLALRVLDNNTGAEIVRELAHAHDCTWGVRALQPGMPGSSTLGQFTIHSPGGPMSDEMRRHWQDQWNQLAYGQRVEGYLGNVITGSPRFSGIITSDLTRSLSGPWEIKGHDSLFMLQQSQVLPGEVIGLRGETGGNFARRFYGTQEAIWDDAFPSDTSANYQVSSWQFTFAGFRIFDPVFGLACIRCITTSPTDAFVVTNTTWSATAQYTSSSVTVHGVIAAGTDTTNAGECGIWLQADSTAQNGYQVLVQMAQTGASTGLYNVSVLVRQRIAGTYSTIAGPTTVFTNVGATFPFELTAVYSFVPISGPGSASTIGIRVLLNGQDTGVLATFSSSAFASGSIGVRCSPNAGGSPTTYVNRIQFHARNSGAGAGGAGTLFGTKRFGDGNVDTAPAVLTESLSGSGQTHLDMLLLAMTFGGTNIRKNPGAGFKGDTLDYGGPGGILNPTGTDLSASVELVEGQNIEANGTLVGSVPELYSTDVRVNSLPGGASGGAITWGRVANVGDAVLVDTVADMGIPGYTMLVLYAQAMQARKVNPLQAIQVRVIRDAKWLGAPGTNGAGPRELDIVGIQIPSLNVQRQTATIAGYDFVEGQADMLVYLSQLPARGAPAHAAQRFQRFADFVGTTYKTR